MNADRFCLPLVVATLAMAASLALTPVAWAADPPAAASAPQGNAAPNPSGGGQGFLPDPTRWAQDVFNQVLVSVAQGLTDAIGGAVDGVMSSSLNFVSQTPPVGSYDSPTVVGLWGTVRNIANAALLLVALWSGYSVMVKEQIGAQYHGAVELLPRLALTALLVNTSLSWARLVIDANNALCGAIGQASLPAWQHAEAVSQALANVLAGLIYVIAALLLLIQMLMRLALLDILLVSAPMALLCWALPQTQSWARLWSATFTGTVFVQFIQVLALKLGGSMMTDLTWMPVADSLLTVFLGVAVIGLTLKLPDLMRGHLGDGLSFPRFVAYRQGARALEGRSSSGSSGGGGSGGAGESGGGGGGREGGAVMGPALLSLVLPDLQRFAAKVGAGLTLALILATAFVISSLAALFGRMTPGGLIPTAQPEVLPRDQLAIMQTASGTCGLPWQVLAAVARVESDFGNNMATSTAGAIGYGQFLPSTWVAYGNGGNPYDFNDALPAMARYLCANGGSSDIRGALFAYNHAGWYVDEVLAVAIHYGYVPPGVPASELLDLAKAQIGRPYVWGGTSPSGFDCSGLVQWVYSRVGIALPRTAQQQFDATDRVPEDQLRPGDLVFFQSTYPSVDRITHVGIYVGYDLMLNAPAEGDVVRQMPLSSPFWAAHYAGGGRVRGLP